MGVMNDHRRGLRRTTTAKRELNPSVRTEDRSVHPSCCAIRANWRDGACRVKRSTPELPSGFPLVPGLEPGILSSESGNRRAIGQFSVSSCQANERDGVITGGSFREITDGRSARSGVSGEDGCDE